MLGVAGAVRCACQHGFADLLHLLLILLAHLLGLSFVELHGMLHGEFVDVAHYAIGATCIGSCGGLGAYHGHADRGTDVLLRQPFASVNRAPEGVGAAMMHVLGG